MIREGIPSPSTNDLRSSYSPPSGLSSADKSVISASISSELSVGSSLVVVNIAGMLPAKTIVTIICPQGYCLLAFVVISNLLFCTEPFLE